MKLCFQAISTIVPWTISDKIVDTFTFLTPYFVTVIPFCPPSLSVQPLSPKAMLCRNAVILGNKQATLNGGAGYISSIFFLIKRLVLVGTLIVLWKDNVSTNYVTDCRGYFTVQEKRALRPQYDTIFKELAVVGGLVV